MTEQQLPLRDIRVLDLSRWIAGPHAALMMGDMGADVVKVESPHGDPARGSGPFVNGESTYFMALNRSKRGITLNLRTSAGKNLLERLIANADILVENYRPGTLADMGFSDEKIQSINPRLILVSISGFGPTGPYAQRGCFDSIAQAMSGLQALTGHAGTQPVRAGYYVADYAAALHACIGALLAVITRERTGFGQRVDIALVESLLSLTGTLIPGYQAAGVVPERLGNSNSHAAPAGLYWATDGAVQLSASSDSLFVKLTNAMERPDVAHDPRFISNQDRLRNNEELNALIQAWVGTKSSKEVVHVLVEYEIPAGPVMTIAEILQDEQLRHRKYFTNLEHPVAGAVEFAGTPVHLSDSPAVITRPSPTIGEHTEEIMASWLSLSTNQIENYRKSGAFSDNC